MTNSPANRKGAAASFANMHQMLSELLAKIDPNGFVEIREALRAQYRPEGVEGHVVELLADLSWRLRGCFALETAILSRGDEADITATVSNLSRLSKYESRLSRDFSRYSRMMQLREKNRKKKEARWAASLARRKPCTSVIQ